MPLLPPVLQQQLMLLDEPAPGQDIPSCANKWFEAIWAYYSMCSMLNPVALVAAKELARAAFVPILIGGMVPTPVPITFFLALEGALRAMLAVTLTPTTMLPLYSVGVPSPVPLAPLLLPVVPIGMASGGVKPPAKIYLAAVISSWMYSNLVMPVIQPAPPVPLF